MVNEFMTLTTVDADAWDQLMQMDAPTNSPVETTVSGVAPVQSWDETNQVLPDIGQVDNKILAAAGKSNTILISVETAEILKTITVSIGDNGNWFVGGEDTGVPAVGTDPTTMPKPSGLYSSAALLQAGSQVTIKAGTQYCVKDGGSYGSFYVLADTLVTLLADTIILTINGAGVIKQYPLGTNVNLIPESEALIGVAFNGTGGTGTFEAPTVHQAWVTASLAKPFAELAQTSAGNAANSAAEAVISADAAEQAKDTAIIKAGEADVSAQAAAASAAEAATSAGNASGAESAAALSAAEAAASATESATSAAEAHADQQQVSADAAAVAMDKMEVESDKNAAAASAMSATASASSATNSQNMAAEWAEKNEDSAITGNPGKYSSKHWAAKAQQWASVVGAALIWKGPWSAATGMAPPTPAIGAGSPFYRISAAGTINSVSYEIGDYIHWDTIGLVWFKIDGTDSVISVNGKSGAVILTAADVGAVSKTTGDIVTGLITFKRDSQPIQLEAANPGAAVFLLARDSSQASKWYIGKGGSGNDDTSFHNYSHNTSLILKNDRVQATRALYEGNERVYSPNYKPAPSALGAVPITGDSTITGALTVTSGVTANLTGDASGNAGTATKLAAAVDINGTAFDGSIEITTALWGASRDFTVGNTAKAVDGSAPVEWSLAEIGAASVYENSAGVEGVDRRISGATAPSKVGKWQANNSTFTPAPYGALAVASNNDVSDVESGTDLFNFFQFHDTYDNRLYLRNDVNGLVAGWDAVMMAKSQILNVNLNVLNIPRFTGFYFQDTTANATLGNNYPVNEAGHLVITRGPYGVIQEYTTYSSTRKFVRGMTEPATFGPWNEISAFGTPFSLTLNSLWTNYGSGYGPAQYMKRGNLVTLSGMITKAASGSLTAFTLPAGYRPPYRKIFTVQYNGGTFRFDVQANGDVMMGSGSTADSIGWLSLDGMSFYVDR